jgi:prevent-host-death family protein
MNSISVTELGQNISQLLRRVREKPKRVQVTVRGEVVALLVPVPESEASDVNSDEAVWTDLDQLAIEIGAHWPKGVSAVEAVREGRD